MSTVGAWGDTVEPSGQVKIGMVARADCWASVMVLVALTLLEAAYRFAQAWDR